MQFSPIRFGIEKASAQNDFFYTIDVAQKETGIRIPVEELRHGGVNKNIRISNLQPLFFTNKIYFNESDINISELESQLATFDIDVESLYDDLMDTLAYQLQFTKGRTFDYSEDDDEDFGSTW
jgi:arginine deiminase